MTMRSLSWLALAALAVPATSGAQPSSLNARSSFRIGGGNGSVLCLAQAMASDPSLTNMFDRGYAIICRDATVPIGLVHVLRLGTGDDPAARLAKLRIERATCAAPRSQPLEDAGPVEVSECALASNAAVPYRVYQWRTAKYLYSAEGLRGYDSALRIALRSVITDRPVKGEVEVALTGAGDPAAFARVQAGTLDKSRALAEAYHRNNVGSYAESAEFFAAVTRGELGRSAQAEALVNEALQKSNLGQFPEADELLNRAQAMLGNDPLVARQLRNYRAMHLLNQGAAEAALAELDKPLPDAAQLPVPAIRSLKIDKSIAARLNADSAATEQLGTGGGALQLEEKVQILNAQIDLLRGPALRLTGDLVGAAAALKRADDVLATVRGGRIASIVWMRAQAQGEMGAIAEAGGRIAEAAPYYRASVQALEIDYPGSAVLQSARGRLAAYLIRSGDTAGATAIYREIVAANAGATNAPPSLARLLAPYAELLLRSGQDRASVSELFDAAQAMVRPGVAQTQAMLARELSGGSDEASRLFRQSVTLTRQVERTRSELARLEQAPDAPVDASTRKQTLLGTMADFQRDQVATQAGLAAFPRYRAVATDVLTLDELQKSLRPGEGYYKLTVIDNLLFAIFATSDSARAYRIAANANELDDLVSRIRRTISTVSFGETVTYPFDVGLSQQLYAMLFGPIDPQLSSLHHLVFEPDGAMLRLTPNLLVRDKAGVDAYVERANAAKGDPFDFTGIRWLGRDLDISTSVSARAFRDVRAAPRSLARRDYLGLGNNARPGPGVALARLAGNSDAFACDPPLAAWDHPISASELIIARNALGDGHSARALVVTGAAFTDSDFKQRRDLADYRIVHFATHGIVTSQSAHCPTQPALMTSFGDKESDGLLTFREIFDLKLDADLVILSACDTAGTATAEATRAAGLGSGGGLALDGLVRAFVGAGGRLVIASHWPVPDDFNATQRLIAGLFSVPPGEATVTALRQSQRKLMDDPKTSHPFYWAAFAVIGDGMAPVRSPAPIQGGSNARYAAARFSIK